MPRVIGHIQKVAALARRELALVTAVLAIAGGLWGFVELTDEVFEGETRAFDEAVLLALRNPADHSEPLGPPWLEEMARDATALGGVGLLTFITLAVAVFLALDRKRRAALFVLAAVAGGVVLSLALKSGFDRPRPDLVPHGSIVYTASFPSGHSMMSAVAYLTLSTLLARMLPKLWMKLYAIAVAFLMALAAGVSRVYLGVHWPTDVLAGWAAGAAWAMLCWIVVLWLQDRRQVESTPSDEAELGSGL